MSAADHRDDVHAVGDAPIKGARAFLDYLAAVASELHGMAVRERFFIIAYLLAMVQLEAERTLHRPRPRREKP